MPRTLTAEAHHPASKKLRVTVFDDGQVVGGDVVDPGSASAVRRKILLPYRVDEATFRALVAAKRGDHVAIPDATSLPTHPLVLCVRSMHADASTAVRHVGVSFADVASRTDAPDDAIIYWDDPRLCCLDVDVDAPIAPHDAAYIATQIRPRPRWWHQSRNGGLHLYYEAAHGFDAPSLAAVAAVWIRQFDARYRVELKSVTRWPQSLTTQEPSPDLGHLRAWLQSEAETVETQRWLEDNGLVVGQRYGHDRCPIEPTPTSGNDPVTVGDLGVYCHRCAGLGLTLGSRKPGFVPYTRLAGVGLRSSLQSCVRHFTHWAQASLVVEASLSLCGDLAQTCYRVLLGVWHGADDPRIDRVFSACPDLVRRKGFWEYRDGTPLKVQHGKRELATLPALQDETGSVIGPRLDRFCQMATLTEFGYDDVDVVHGHKVWGHWLDYPDRRLVQVVYRGDAASRPRYRDASDRLDEAAMWAVFDRYLPGLDRRYLTLLIAARGFAEQGSGMPPLVYAYGTSGAGKSQTVNVAAAVVGDRNTDVMWSHDNARFRQAIQDGTSRGSFCTVNELCKSARRVRMGMDLALEPVLTLTPESTSHQLYTGPVALGRVPVMVFTESYLDDKIAESDQLGRRIVAVQLSRGVSWDGRGKPADFRTFGDDARHAADSLLSLIIDRYFLQERDWFGVAKEIGYDTIQVHAGENRDELKREFFRLCCDAPDAPDMDQMRWGGRGWRKITRTAAEDERNAFEHLYLQLCGGDFTTPINLFGSDWPRLLGIDADIQFQARPVSHVHRNGVGVRFYRRLSKSRQDYLVNAEVTR